MSQFDPAAARSTIVFGALFVILAVSLHLLYQTPTFEEGTEPRLLFGLFLAALAAIWLGRSGAPAIVKILASPLRRFGTRALVALILLALILFLIVAGIVLDGFPNSGDELAHVMQAQTYAHGKLWISPPQLMEFFRQYRFYDVNQKWVSQYPPGWAMILAPAAVLGLPLWIVNPLIGAATLAAFFRLARRYVRNETAWLGTLALCVSPFYVLNSGSYFSHNLTAIYGVAFALFGLRYIERGGIGSAIAAGAFVGLIGITRTQSVVIFVIPFVAALAMTPGRRAGLFWFGLYGAPFLAALLAYNNVITGNPLTAVAEYYNSEPLGSPSATSLRLTLQLFERLFLWTSPALSVGFFFGLFFLLRQRRADFCDWVMPLAILLYLHYGGDGGNQYGPRYYFEAWPFALLTILKTIDPILFDPAHKARAWASSAVVVSLIMEIGYLPARFEREHQVVMERQDVYAQAKELQLDNAIVIIATEAGTIRPMLPKDLVRNGLYIGDQKVIYALPLVDGYTRLQQAFPDRSIYLYFRGRLFKRNTTGQAAPSG